MKSQIEEPSFLFDRGLRHLVAAFGGRTEFAAHFERPNKDYSQERRRLRRKAAARKDFERAWKTY